ncbi:TPA: hypothetical protein N0F65_010998 [Lagenidium giganteum]|uniref:Uncharacterized protein n=1 Tax=Lagenidium giganteum TaxID=4803 RepID=A0AAV2Z874_9STRA|nr:TPA: hypothetical protein N0F65_010998 [Lagenidium giganteum]
MAHPDFEFIKLDYNYIGFRSGIYDLSVAKFINMNDILGNVHVRKYINQDIVVKNETPYLNSYFRYQFDDEMIEFIYVMIGRLLTQLNDTFDFMVMIYGEGGC